MNKSILSIISILFFISSASAEVIKNLEVIGEYYYGPNISDNQACEYAKENAKNNVPTKWSNRQENITTQDLYKIAFKQTVMVVCRR